MHQLGLFSPVSLAINSNKNLDIKFSYIYSSMKTLSENPLKHFPFSFHLAGATYQAIIYPAKMSWKVIQAGKEPGDKSHICCFLLPIILLCSAGGIRVFFCCCCFIAQIRSRWCESSSGLFEDCWGWLWSTSQWKNSFLCLYCLDSSCIQRQGFCFPP